MKQTVKSLGSTVIMLALVLLSMMSGSAQQNPNQQFLTVVLPPGFRIEKVVGGLTYPTSITWDDRGRMYVVEAGGAFLEEPPSIRILRVRRNGTVSEIVNLSNQGIEDSAVGLTWYNDRFYITHRAADRTGAVSRVSRRGTVEQLFRGIIDSQSEHQVNDIKVGPDGMMYVASGPAANSAVLGLDNAPFINRSPEVRTTGCRNYVLTGQNFETPDFRTADPGDTVQTGAFVPFGTPTAPGQVIPGTNKCGGAILRFDPSNPEATLQPFADGFRNIIGFAWNQNGGEMYAAVNGYDVRGSRPVNDQFDATYRISQGTWYGFPDFSAALEPLTDPKFDSPDSLQAPIFINEVFQGRFLGFVIDHAASGLTPPDQSLVAGLHEINSSPSLLDVAPASWGEFAGQIFVAEWGDLAPQTTPLRDGFAGFRISRIDPATGGGAAVVPFVRNQRRGPASAQGAQGQGIERPFDVKFGPDGAMYIVDYGIARVNPARPPNQGPYEFPPFTGAIWRVSKMRSTNLLTNSSFEQGFAPWQDWGNSAVVANTDAPDGSFELRIGTGAGGSSQTVSAEANTTYRLSGSGRITDGETGWIVVHYLDSAGNQIAEQSVIQFNNTTYEQKQLSIQTPPNTAQLRVWTWKNEGAGYFFVDDISLTRQ